MALAFLLDLFNIFILGRSKLIDGFIYSHIKYHWKVKFGVQWHSPGNLSKTKTENNGCDISSRKSPSQSPVGSHERAQQFGTLSHLPISCNGSSEQFDWTKCQETHVSSARKNLKEGWRKGDREREKEEKKEGGGKGRETESEREREGSGWTSREAPSPSLMKSN